MMTQYKPEIDIDKIFQHWIETSDHDYKTMLTLFDAKSYGWSLFLGHLVIEKLLKALYVRRYQAHAPFTHNLFRLAELAGITLSDEYADWLDTMTAFNMNARYDDYKREFYSLCTPEYTMDWIGKINTLRSWIKETLLA